MTIAESRLPEFDHEMATTRTLLERVPHDHADWKPHEKSMALGYLASHTSMLPGWIEPIMLQPEMDMSPPGGQKYTVPRFGSTAEMLDAFDGGVTRARAALATAPDSAMMEPWSLKNGGETIFTMPRVAVIRSFAMNHLIHHRGQLSVYLRLLDVPLPSIYGPTADTQ